MSAVTRIIYTFFLLPMLVILSACSDSGSESEISIDDRRLNIDTPFSVLEGGDGDVSIIEVSFVSTVTGTISYSTFNVTAASRSDYIPVAGDIEVTEGVEYTINISIEGDDQIEGDELIGLSLTLNGEDLVTYYGRIENDDLPPVTIKTTSVLEGDTGTSLLRFTISLDEEVVDPYTFALVTPVVDVSLNDPENDIFYAIPDIDFEAIDQNITFTEGVSEISIDVVVLADNVIELDERVFIQLNPLQNGLSAEGLIRTDDAVDINGFDLSSVSSEILEGTSASVTDIEWGLVEYLVTVDRPENIIDEQVVQIKLIGKDEQLSDGSTDWASLGEDYCANPVLIDGVCDSVGSYVLEPGIDSTSLMVSFYVRKDLDVEESEEIEIQLQNDQGVVFGNFRHTIIQDDNPSLTVSYLDTSGILQTANLADLVLAAKNDGFTIEILEPADSDSQSVSSIWFNLDFPLKDEFKPSYEFSEVRVSQIGVSDYYVENAGAGVITFAENSTATTNIDVTALHDDDYEGREVLNLEIEDFGVIPITIIDNDLPILKITETTGADILRNDAHFSAITLSESLSANSSDATTTYNFNFALEGGIEALDDLNFSYEINDVFFKDNETAINNIAACTYLKDDNRNRKAIINGEEGATEVPDYQILIGGSELAPNTDYIFEKTKPKLEFSMVVNNDEFVECLEFIFLKFTLSPITNQADDETVLSSTIDVNFEITNTDKATLKVVGWNSDEGSSDQAPLATTTKNFSLELDQAIVTSDIQYTLTSSTNDALSCGDDLQGITVPYVNTVSFNGSDTDLNKAIGVLIQQDNIVEPEEACQLSITNMTSEDSAVIDVEYFNETGKNTGLYAVDLVNTYASGVIQNDDLLTISVNDPALEILEPSDPSDAYVSLGTIQWDKVIANNTGDMTVTLTLDCTDTDAIDCAIAEDLNIENTLVINSSSVNPLPIGVEAVGDNVVETTETVIIALSKGVGGEYIGALSANFTGEITNEDELSFVADELLPSRNLSNNNESGSRTYQVTWGNEKSVAATVPSLFVDLNTVSEAIRKTVASQTDFEFSFEDSNAFEILDNKIHIKDDGQSLSVGGSVNFTLKLEDDDLIETTEDISIVISKSGSGFIDDFTQTLDHTIGIDDKLLVTLTPPADYVLGEGSSTEESGIPIIYTLGWQGKVASNVPALMLDLSHQGSAVLGNDFTVTPQAALSVNTFTIKAADVALNNATGSADITLNIINESIVEIDELIETTLQYILGDMTGPSYIELNNATSYPITLGHTIENDADTAEFTLTQVDSSYESEEEDEEVKEFRLSWNNTLGTNVESINLQLPFSGSADKGNNLDYTVTVTSGYESNLSIDGDAVQLIKNIDTDLPSGYVSFNVNIKDDELIEETESITATLGTVDSTPDFINIGASKSLGHNIIFNPLSPNTDKIQITLTRVSGLDTAEEGIESELVYQIAWNGELGVNTGDIPVELAFTGLATRDVDYEISVHSDSLAPSASNTHGKLKIAGDIFTIQKDTDTALSAGNVKFTVKVIDDTANPEVEIEESYSATLAAIGATPAYVAVAAAQTISHSITDTDTTILSLVAQSGQSNSSQEENTRTRDFELKWTNAVASNVPELIVSLPLSSNATGSDFNVSTGEDTVDLEIDSATQMYRFKALGTALEKNGKVEFSYTIVNDNVVEIDEVIAASLTVPNLSELATYVDFSAGSRSLSHTITDIDKTELSIQSSNTNSVSAIEGTTVTNYTLAWTNPVASDVPVLTVNLPLTGNASQDDFTVAPGTGLTVSGTAYTFKTAGTALTENGTVTFSYTVVNDNIVEIEEDIEAQLTTSGSLSTYATFHATANSLSHSIQPDDDKTELSLVRGNSEANTSDEEIVTTIPYALSWTNPVAEDVPALAASIIFSGATETDDFQLNSLPTELTRSGDKFTFKSASSGLSENGSVGFTVTTINDDLVELDETLIATLQFVDSDDIEVGIQDSLITYATISASNSVLHTLENTEKTELTVVRDTSSGEQSTTKAENESSVINFNISATKAVDAAVGNITIELPVSGTAAAGVDYTFTDLTHSSDGASVAKNGDVYTIHSSAKPLTSGIFAKFSIAVQPDATVELHENFTASLILPAASSDNAELGSEDTVGHEISNDDFIDITLNNGANLEEGNDVMFTVSPYESSGLAGTVISQALTIVDNETFYGSGALFDIGTVTLPTHTIVASLAAASTTTLFSIEDDVIIEPNETFIVPIDLSAHSDYVRVQASGSATQNIEYTIEDNDKLYVELEKFQTEDSLGANHSYNMSVCYGSNNPVIQGVTSVTITPDLSAVSIAGSGVLTTKQIISADLVDIKSSVELDLSLGFISSGSQSCQQTELFKTVADTTVEGTEWINVELSWPDNNADSRFTSTNFNGGGIDVAVIDNDFPYMTQTGASKCIATDAGQDGYLRTDTSDCYGSGAADSRPRQDYTRAEQSNGTHPSQHFTLIANGSNSSIPEINGEPSNNVPAQPGSTFNGDNGYCLFDSYSNNVWLIGGFNVDTDLSIFSTDHIPYFSASASDKTALTLQAEAQDRLTWCGMTSGAFYQWRLPTVDELLTTLNIEHLRGATEMSSDANVVLSSYFQNHFVDTEETGNDFNAKQDDCELESPSSCVPDPEPDPYAEPSTITSYYWTGEYCLEADAMADSVAAGSSINSATELRATATQARADSDTIQNDLTKTDQEKTDANNAATTAEGLADTAEGDALTAENTASTSIENQTHAWAVDFASAQLMCLNKESDTAHVRLVYKEVE